MYLSVGNELWNLDNAEGIVTEDNNLIIVYDNHNEIFKALHDAESVLCEIEQALITGVKVFYGLPERLETRDEDTIYHKFG